MEILTYLQIFSAFWCSALLTFFPGVVTYRQFALIVAILSAVALLYLFVQRKGKLPKSILYVFAVYLLLLGLYALTPFFYSNASSVSENNYHSFFLSLAGQVFPAALTASLVPYSDKYREKIKNLVPIVAIVFTLLALYSVLFPTSSTTGGYLDNENGLNYQSAAYLASYAAALAEYYLFTKDEVRSFLFHNNKLITVLMVLSIVLDFIALLFAGGRGGFVTFIILLLVSLYIAFTKKKLTRSSIAKIGAILVFIIIAGFFGILLVNNLSISTSGYGRIVSLLQNGLNADLQRSSLWSNAIQSFLSSPLWGHGLGSVFYELGLYSHNCITDSLVETGLIGTIVFVVLIINTFRKGINLIKQNVSDSLWFYFFLCGFIMSLFSGYYLTRIPLYWGLVFILLSPSSVRYQTNLQEEQKDEV